MIPNVFVSSTILDLHHLRDSIRDVIMDIGYNPVMSEYGEVGYLPTTTAIDSCYLSIKECHFAVLVVGKRYGSIVANNKSVTHNECDAAMNERIPIFSLVDREVLSYKAVYDANLKRGAAASYPGMDNPERTFAFIQQIQDSPNNNGILPFVTTAEARIILKKQIAHFFGALLNDKIDPIKLEIKDVLSEIKTLRHELVTKRGKDAEKNSEPRQFLAATRFLLDDQNKIFRQIVEATAGSTDEAVPILISATSFDNFLQRLNLKVKISPETHHSPLKIVPEENRKYGSAFMIPKDGMYDLIGPVGNVVVTRDNHLVVNEPALQFLNDHFVSLKNAVSHN